MEGKKIAPYYSRFEIDRKRVLEGKELEFVFPLSVSYRVPPVENNGHGKKLTRKEIALDVSIRNEYTIAAATKRRST